MLFIWSNHHKLDARISVLATANPKGDKFVGTDPEQLKKQLPFDAALLSRFHLVFFARKPDMEGFKEITRKIIKGTKKKTSAESIDFIKKYIVRAEKINVEIPRAIEQDIIDFAEILKKEEGNSLIEVSPRLVIGLVRLVKASARLELRSEVEHRDLELVKGIFRESLKVI